MKIELKNILIEDLIKGYVNDYEEGVYAYGGKLNIRPKYQRELIYDEEQQKAVIDTILKGFPLNSIYWCDNENDNYEVLDGQQRIMSICKYFKNDFMYKKRLFCNLTDTEKKRFCNYKLTVYFCIGNDEEKLNWFKTINISGVALSQQELRNAVYSKGKWLTEAKKLFSKQDCWAQKISKNYVDVKWIRQEGLELAISWIANDKTDKKICEYMAKHCYDSDANELKKYFDDVIKWIEKTFVSDRYYKEMKKVDWGRLYHKYHKEKIDFLKIKEQVDELMQDVEIVKKNGIFEYVLSNDRSVLELRKFSDSLKRAVLEKQGGKCKGYKKECNKKINIDNSHADHIIPWSYKGKNCSTTEENCQVLCRDCNLRKSNNY